METLPLSSTPPDPDPRRVQQLRDAAHALESNFLAEMLKSAGFGKARDGFGGGEGDDQYQSFMIRAQADAMVRSGGIGLSEPLFQALMEADRAGRG